MWFLGSFVFASASFWAGVQTATAQSATAAGVPKVEELFKNIQVFNGQSAEQLRPTMMFFRVALGVTCMHCHVEQRELNMGKIELTDSRGKPGWWYQDPQREIDIPGKQMARMMIKMTAAINKENFGGRQVVTCFTCHRGNIRPVAVASFHATSVPGLSTDITDSKPVSGVSADEVVDQFIAAVGGVPALQKISTRVAKGTKAVNVLFAGEGPVGGAVTQRAPLAVEIHSKTPGMRAIMIRQGNGEVRSFNGNTGWHQGRNSFDIRHQPRQFRGDELDHEKMEDPYFFALQLKQFVRDMRVERTEKIGGKEAYVVSGRTASLPDVQLYFDRETGLLVRSVALTQTLVGRFANQMDFADFRTVDGMKVPFRWMSTQPAEREAYTYQMEQVQNNVSVDDSKFAKPGKYLVLFESRPPAPR